MDNTNWFKQTKDKPLFPDLLWSRPENKNSAGKLLIIGGNAHGFSVVAQAYQEAIKAGAGAVKVLLPDVLRKTVTGVFDVAEFAPSTTSGSFNQKSLATMLELSDWADGVLIAGELGRNAETSATLENLLRKNNEQITITKDAVNNFYSSPDSVLTREKTTLVLSLSQLQRLAKESGEPKAITFDMDILRLVGWLQVFTEKYNASIVVKHLSNIFVASGGKVSSTKLDTEIEVWRVKIATHCAIWWMQNPNKEFEALSTSIVIL